MSIGNLYHSGFLSYLKYDTNPLVEEFTTTSANQEILFKEGTEQRYLNALFLENTGSATLYARILPSEYVLTVPAGESRTYDLSKTNGIQVMGASGQTLRWSGCFY